MGKMKKIIRKILCGVSMLGLAVGCMVSPVSAAVDNGVLCAIDSNTWENWPQAENVQSGTGIVMEASTGTILFDKGMDDIRYPASITKVMTAIIALENSTLDTTVTFTETGLADAYAGSSNINPQLGETFTMEQCLYMILIKSANDVSTQVAEVVGGSVDNFVNMMNEKAVELGCKNTHFANANGLENENHYTTAHDMALIGQEALKLDMFRSIVSTSSYTVGPTNMTAGSRVYDTHVDMLPGRIHAYDGCFGGKTGYTDVSQSTLITFDKKNGMELISVVMYAPGSDVAATDSMQLLDYAYNNFMLQDGKVVTAQGYPVEDQAVVTPKPTKGASKTDSKDQSSSESAATTINTSDSSVADTSSGKSSFSNSMGIMAYIIIGVLAAIVLIGLVMILISAIVKAKKKKRRKKRMQQKRNLKY